MRPRHAVIVTFNPAAIARLLCRALLALCLGHLLIAGALAAQDQGADAVATAMHLPDTTAASGDCSKELPDAQCLSCCFQHAMHGLPFTPVDPGVRAAPDRQRASTALHGALASALSRREPDPPRA